MTLYLIQSHLTAQSAHSAMYVQEWELVLYFFLSLRDNIFLLSLPHLYSVSRFLPLVFVSLSSLPSNQVFPISCQLVSVWWGVKIVSNFLRTVCLWGKKCPISCRWWVCGVKSKIVPSGAFAPGLGLLPVWSWEGGDLPASCRQVAAIVPQLSLSYWNHHTNHCLWLSIAFFQSEPSCCWGKGSAL